MDLADHLLYEAGLPGADLVAIIIRNDMDDADTLVRKLNGALDAAGIHSHPHRYDHAGMHLSDLVNALFNVAGPFYFNEPCPGEDIARKQRRR